MFKENLKRRCILVLFVLAIVGGCVKNTVPLVTTDQVGDISGSGVTLKGNVTDDGGDDITSRGFRYGTSNPPTAIDITIDGGSGVYMSTVTDLSPSTTYYVQAYAVNFVGEGTGDVVSFLTLGSAPETSTLAATEITTSTVTLNGLANPNHVATKVSFEYGSDSQYGTTVNSEQDTMIGTSSVPVTATLTDLTPGSTYHFRVKAVNILGVVYGDDQTFTTLGRMPEIDNWYTSEITQTTARINFDVNPGWLSTEIAIEYGQDDTYGNSTPLTSISDSGDLSVAVYYDLNDLNPLSEYHVRVKVKNELGTIYSDDLEFSTYGSVADVRGILYKTVKIGDLIWMAENLRVEVFNDGSAIDYITGDTEWTEATTPGYCWYNNDSASYAGKYGALYNWLVIDETMNSYKNVCPEGWHVAREMDWYELYNYLMTRGYGFEGSGSDIAKSMAASTDWYTSAEAGTPGNDLNSNNVTGFSALPAGLRTDGSPTFTGLTIVGVWWSMPDAFIEGEYYSLSHRIINNYEQLDLRHQMIQDGMSIRCVKDF